MKYALFCICLFLTGCSSLISSTFNIGNKVAPVLMDERELSDDIKDIQTNLAIRSRLTAEKAAYGLDVEITVFEGEVLINGAIPSIDDIEKIVEIVWQTENVENVYLFFRNMKDSLVNVNLRLHKLEMLSTSIDDAVSFDGPTMYEFQITNKSNVELNANTESVAAEQSDNKAKNGLGSFADKLKPGKKVNALEPVPDPED